MMLYKLDERRVQNNWNHPQSHRCRNKNIHETQNILMAIYTEKSLLGCIPAISVFLLDR